MSDQNNAFHDTLEKLSNEKHDIAIMVMVWTAQNQGQHICNSMIDGIFIRSYVYKAQTILYKCPDIAVEVMKGNLTIPEGWKAMKGVSINN